MLPIGRARRGTSRRREPGRRSGRGRDDPSGVPREDRPAGFAMALAADVRIAGESTRMNAAFIRLGLSACDVGVSYFLPRLVGASIAAELLLTGNFIDAARAERIGLVSRVVSDTELEDAARAMAADMLRNSPIGLRLTEECLKLALDAGSLEEVVAMEDRNQVLAASTSDFREGVMAFPEKRPAQFRDA